MSLAVGSFSQRDNNHCAIFPHMGQRKSWLADRPSARNSKTIAKTMQAMQFNTHVQCSATSKFVTLSTVVCECSLESTLHYIHSLTD